MPGDDEPSVDLGYIKCDPCIDGDHAGCIGLTHTRPFCGCSICPWLYWPEIPRGTDGDRS